MWFKKIFKKIPTHEEDGQGLVEYALILVLVAVVAIAILLILGPTVGNVFSRVVCTLQPGAAGGCGGSGAITSVGTSPNGANRQVSVTVSQADTVVTVTIISGSGNVAPPSKPCDPGVSCTFQITSPSASGTVRAEGGGGSMTANW